MFADLPFGFRYFGFTIVNAAGRLLCVALFVPGCCYGGVTSFSLVVLLAVCFGDCLCLVDVVVLVVSFVGVCVVDYFVAVLLWMG